MTKQPTDIDAFLAFAHMAAEAIAPAGVEDSNQLLELGAIYFGRSKRRRAERTANVRERISAQEAASILGVPERTVQELAIRARIPGAAKVGRRWTFNERELRNWIKLKEAQLCRSAAICPAASTSAVQRSTRASRSLGRTSDDAYTQMMSELRGRG